MEPLQIFSNAAEGTIAIIAIIGNSLVLVTLFRTRGATALGAGSSSTNYLIASLASADFLVGAVGIPCVIATNFSFPTSFYGCLVTNCAIVMMTQISIFSLLLIAIERFIAVVAPVAHRRHWRGKTIAVTVGVAWVSAVTLGCVPVFGWHPPEPKPEPRLEPEQVSWSIDSHGWNQSSFVCSFDAVIDRRYMVLFNFFGCVLTPLVIIYAIYGYIYSFILRKLRTGNQSTAMTIPGNQDTIEKDATRNKLKKESKATKRIFLILVSFTLSWLPIHVMGCVTLFTGSSSFAAVTFAVLLSHSNSAINPFIYSLTNRGIAEALKKTVGLHRVRTRVGVEPQPQGVVDNSAAGANSMA